jgi:serine/threonine-protein kinase HipA
MSLTEINCCPSTLRSGFVTYSPAAQKTLFGGRSKRVSHILSFGPPGKNSEQNRGYNENRERISISGMVEKYSLRLEKNNLFLTETGGTHILKPVPAARFDRLTDMPANEHVSMQIATQVFDIRTAACGMIFFDDGSPAYITRRFDYKPDRSGKYQVEDFAALLAKTPEKGEDDFKYNASYLDMAAIIRKQVAAAPVVMLEFLRLLVFNYLIANGDAHLKNFSLMETAQGDFLLAPAYDLLCTALHTNDSPLALRDGLYDGDYDESTYEDVGTYTRTSFIVFAEKAGVNPALARTVVNEMMREIPQAIALVERSFLSDEAKSKYIDILKNRHKCLELG